MWSVVAVIIYLIAANMKLYGALTVERGTLLGMASALT